MKRRAFIAASLATGATCLCVGQEDEVKVSIGLNSQDPSASRGRVVGMETVFPIGFGKHGTLPAGESFQGGYSLLGRFEVNAVLTRDRFEMKEDLIAQSGKSREWLAMNLFRNMSSIDFDGDGKGGEYGSAFIGLDPLDSAAKQPFHFGEYKGVFRWYTYAIHGTHDESRVGKCVTGGCINVRETDLAKIAESIEPGDQVIITSS